MVRETTFSGAESDVSSGEDPAAQIVHPTDIKQLIFPPKSTDV
jgi:hypothetical protein